MRELSVLLVAVVGGLQLSAWMVPPVGVCFSDQPDSHFGWEREVMAGAPELCFPRKV